MARRFNQDTLHMGRVAYLHARGLTELDFPVLVGPMDERYRDIIAEWPVQDEAGFFYRVWEPTRPMRLVATDVFGNRYTGRRERIEQDEAIWKAVRRIHRLASMAPQENQEQARQFIYRVSQSISRTAATPVPAAALAPVAEVYERWGLLFLPDHTTASVVGATLLLMLGVPRERVAVFGMYYQDPTTTADNELTWYGGFLSGTLYYTVMGVFLGGGWLPIDFSLPKRLSPVPLPHLRHPNLGQNAETGQPMIIDYVHPYTMLFAPPDPGGDHGSPLLSRIPLIRLPGWSGLLDKIRSDESSR